MLPEAPGESHDKQETRLADLLRCNLKSVRSYLLKEEFQFFWQYRSAYVAGSSGSMVHANDALADRPIKKVARMLRRHRALLLNWFQGQGQFPVALSRI
ncbi:MAG: transposase [Gammaproteobacteria bacterium]|nr:transposase [Gammaproteobacteria bacterium]